MTLKLALFGSCLRDPQQAHDVDLLAVDGTDQEYRSLRQKLVRMGRIGRDESRPIDIFWDAWEGDLNWGSYYDPAKKTWVHDQRFCGKGFFSGAREITLEELAVLIRH